MLKYKAVRISLVVLASLVLFILLTGLLVPVLFGDQIKAAFIRELNKNLATEVVISEDDIQLEVLRHFPYSSVSFSNVAIRESYPGSKENFLEAGSIRLLFNTVQVLRKNYTVSRIIIEDASVSLERNAGGQINYKFWKDSEGSDSEEVAIELQEVSFKNVRFAYRDIPSKVFMTDDINNGKLSGNLQSDKFDLKVDARLFHRDLQVGGDHYLSDQDAHVNGTILVSVPDDLYTLNNMVLEVAGNKILTNGTVTASKETLLDLDIAGQDLELEKILQLLPERYAGKIEAIASEGQLSLTAKVLGTASSASTPGIEASFNLHDGTLYHAAAKEKIRRVDLQGSYSNGTLHRASSSSLQLTSLSGEYLGEPISGTLSYENFIDPTIRFDFNGRLPASVVFPFLIPGLEDISGSLLIDHFRFAGKIRAENSRRAFTEAPTGRIVMEDVAFKTGDEKISLKGTLATEGIALRMDDLSLNGWGTDIQFSGTLAQWLPVIVDPQAQLAINGTLQCNSIDLDRMLAVSSSPSAATAKEPAEKTAASAELWERLSGTIALRMDQFSYQDLELDNLACDLYFGRSLIAFRDIKGSTKLGKVNMNATFRRMPDRRFMLETIGMISGMDIARLFDSFGNFGQDDLTSKNLKGTADIIIENANMTFDENYELQYPSVYVLAQVAINDGELIDYKPLEELSGYIDVDELKHIRFNRMENQIEINKEVITIPAMEVNSSALNLYVTGTHTFDNHINYQFKIRLGEILSKKFLKRHKQDEYESSGNGVNIYVSMTGTVDHPIIEVNKKGAKDAFEQEEDKGGFLDIFKPDTPLYEEPLFKKERPEETETDTLEFIEWEDD